MGSVIAHRQLVMERLSSVADLIRQQHPATKTGIDVETIFDEQRDQYLLVRIGWSGGRRIRATVAYVRLRNGKIWIEEDLTEDGIANHLLAAGVPPDDIVLAFQPPEARRHTEFAVN